MQSLLTRPPLERLALASLAATVIAAMLQAAEPFEHGIWLVAYLFLVGFLAQLLLARGQAKLRALTWLPAPSPRTRRAEVVLWNLGVLAVPLGVLAEMRLAVLAGTLSLLMALALFASSVREPLSEVRRPRLLGAAYVALLVVMASSAITGLGLASDIPWR